MKPTINIGNKETTREKQVKMLLERGYDIFVLRLRVITEYPLPIHGFDDIRVETYKSPNSMEVNYRLNMHPCSYTMFEPNEEGVATAYVPGTRRNFDVIATHFYSNQFVLMEILTPEGTIPQAQAIARVKERADYLGIKPARDNSAFQRHLDSLKTKGAEKPPIQAQVKPAAPQEPSAISDGAPAKEPQLPTGAIPNTIDEAEEMAENQVMTKYAALIDFMKKKSPQGYKGLAEYKQVIKPEIEQIKAELMKLAGLGAEKPPVEEPEGEEALVK